MDTAPQTAPQTATEPEIEMGGMGGGGYTGLPNQFNTIVFFDERENRVRHLKRSEFCLMFLLVGRLLRGEFEVWVPEKRREIKGRGKNRREVWIPTGKRLGIKQATLALEMRMSVRQLERLLDGLERFGLLLREIVRTASGHVQGTIYNLAPTLRMWPEARQRSWGVLDALRAKMSDRPEASKTAPDAAPNPSPEPDSCGKSPERGPENPDPASEAYPTFSSSTIEQEHPTDALSEKQQQTPVQTASEAAQAESSVVALLVKEGVEKSRALRCLEEKGIDRCREALENFRYVKPRFNRGGWLCDSILKDYALHPQFLRDRQRRRNEEARRARIDREAKERRKAYVPSSPQPLRDQEAALQRLPLAELQRLRAETLERFRAANRFSDPAVQRVRAWEPGGLCDARHWHIIVREVFETLRRQRQPERQPA